MFRQPSRLARQKKNYHKTPAPADFKLVIVAMTLSVPSYILAESGLSFLGSEPAARRKLGQYAQRSAGIREHNLPPWLLTPWILIFVAVLSFNLIGDTIRDILDPKSKMR